MTRVSRGATLPDGLRVSRAAFLVPAVFGLLLTAACDDDDDLVGADRFGSIRVSTSTTGYAPDFPESVEVGMVDGGAITVTPDPNDPTQGEVVLQGAPVGSVEVQVMNLPAHCTAAPASATVEVTANAESTADFAITCAPVTGSTTVTLTQTGAPEDADDQITVIVDPDAEEPLASELVAAGTPFQFLRIEPGEHLVTIGDLAANCTLVAEADTQLVTIAAGQDQPLTFTADCVPNLGSIEVTVATAAGDDPDGYTLQLDDGTPQAVSANEVVTFTDVRAGPHTVTIGGLAAGCNVSGGNTALPVEVLFGETPAAVSFTVSCPVEGGGDGGGAAG